MKIFRFTIKMLSTNNKLLYCWISNASLYKRVAHYDEIDRVSQNKNC